MKVPSAGENLTSPPGPQSTCKGNPNASNSSLCGGMKWACGPDQTYANIQVKIFDF